MKVLFISSGNIENDISPITRNQGESLIRLGVEVEFFAIRGKGVWTYLRYIFILRAFLKNNNFDIIHAHYSFCGYLAGLTFRKKKIVVSLMGSDAAKIGLELILVNIFSRLLWGKTIVKSESMKTHFQNKKMIVIPNGVDFAFFKPLSKEDCQKETGFANSKKHIVFFLSHADRPEKNLPLANEVIHLLNDPTIEFHIISYVEQKKIPILLNASDMLLLTSTFEGSPNIIKEAMACNIPIVTTDVGDVRLTIGNTEGCYITSYNPIEIKESILKALNLAKRTNGRNNISFLDRDVIANKLISVYKELNDKI